MLGQVNSSPVASVYFHLDGAADGHPSSCVVTFTSQEALKAAVAASGRVYVNGCAVEVRLMEDGPVDIEFFDEECPELVQNFLALLKHPKFEGHLVHRIKGGCWIQAGDLVDGSGAHSLAAAGGLLRHESYQIKHDRPGLVGMCCHGKDTIGSQFYITLRDLRYLDSKFVVIGRVIRGMGGLMQVGNMKTKHERPAVDVKLFAEA